MKEILEPRLLEAYPIKEIDGEKLVDITVPIFKENATFEIKERDLIVTEEFEGKLPLASRTLYFSDNTFEAIMHINNIMNPFSLQSGDRIDYCTNQSFEANIQIEDIKGNESQKEFTKQFSQQDQDRILSKIEVSEIRSPNMAPEGTSPTVNVDGRIILGANFNQDVCVDRLSTAQALSENIKKAIKAAINPVS